MPELPEVETVRRGLEAGLLGRRIRSVELHRRDVLSVPGDPPAGFSRQRRPTKPRPYRPEHLLRGAVVTKVRRHGKQLALCADDGRTLLVHLGMTGAMVFDPGDGETELPAHAHAVWRIESDDRRSRRLAFIDPRRFGGLRCLGPEEALETVWSSLGPDALTIRAKALREALSRTRRPLKALLLDQSAIAGLGNIYVDEALFGVGLRPSKPAEDAADVAADLGQEIRQVLRAAISAGGSTARDYRDTTGRAGRFQDRHRVYGRGGRACLRCDATLESGVIAQRTTVWCPGCQS